MATKYIGIVDKFEVLFKNPKEPSEGQTFNIEIHAINVDDIDNYLNRIDKGQGEEVRLHFFYINRETNKDPKIMDYYLYLDYLFGRERIFLFPLRSIILNNNNDFKDYEGRIIVFEDEGSIEATTTSILDFNSNDKEEPITIGLDWTDIEDPKILKFASILDTQRTKISPYSSETQIVFDKGELTFCVANVGQGSLNAIIDNSKKVQLYLDLGGGYGPNNNTYPATFTPCMCAKPVIIISHLDRDHVETLRRNLNLIAENSKFIIIPDQAFTPFYETLFRKFQELGGTIYRLQRIASPIVFGSLEFGYCTGNANIKNDSGIYCYFIDSNGNLISYSADAEPRFVPNFMIKEFGYMIAPHHGANLNNSCGIPQRKIKTIYSFGEENTYQHPSETMVGIYREHLGTNDAATNNNAIDPNIQTLNGIVIGNAAITIHHPDNPCAMCNMTFLSHF